MSTLIELEGFYVVYPGDNARQGFVSYKSRLRTHEDIILTEDTRQFLRVTPRTRAIMEAIASCDGFALEVVRVPHVVRAPTATSGGESDIAALPPLNLEDVRANFEKDCEAEGFSCERDKDGNYIYPMVATTWAHILEFFESHNSLRSKIMTGLKLCGVETAHQFVAPGTESAEYVVVSSHDMDDFTSEVNERIKAGFTLVGGVVVSGEGPSSRRYYQTMIRQGAAK